MHYDERATNSFKEFTHFRKQDLISFQQQFERKLSQHTVGETEVTEWNAIYNAMKREYTDNW